MTTTILLVVILCLAMVLPYLPGSFDASAATFSFVAQVASFTSLLMVPAGVAWLISPRRSGRWRMLALTLGGVIGFVMVVAAVSRNQLALGVAFGLCVSIFVRTAYQRSRTAPDHDGNKRSPIAFYLLCVPIVLVTFRATVLPRAADWSLDRAIRNSAELIVEIEAFRQRRGHYPLSLQAQHPDFPTGVIGIERFHYEPTGEAYNLYFVRPHIGLDAEEAIVFNPRDEHHFTAHAVDILQYDGEQLSLRRGDRRRTRLAQPHWVAILLD